MHLYVFTFRILDPSLTGSINCTTYVVVAPNDPELVWISRWKFTLLGSQQFYLKATVYTNNIKEHINVYIIIYSHINIYIYI